ncbi:hypothetical protein HNR02_007031 [Amycolatopsis endophytica]|uniref:Uncharacterized protein n=1 Tax=Amycolatopsis endophytica TaxID=860233 RepID=A0A853BGJ7_9PSEU|nr:hypothetical protein [Amycolatopsis endophytica]NYI93656.1 hypothetical protein [Amycolatopsis endophytica]
MEYDRHRHVLHEMTRLGATIEHAGGRLTHEEIDFLDAAEARTACITARRSYGVEGITHLYRDLLRASDRMWKEVNAGSGKNAPLRFATADVTVTGLRIEELHAALGPANLSRDYASLNPDHYFIEEDGDGMHAMETFGMYGAPTEMHLIADPAIPVPVEPAAGYLVLTAGSTSLASDGTEINVLAFHQYKPLDNGFAVKLGSLYPAATRRQIVEGHKVHMAIEFRAMCELAAGADAGLGADSDLVK